MFKYSSIHSPDLTSGPGRLKSSNSAPVLQYGSGLSSDFLAKMWSTDTPLFLCNTQFYFPLPSLKVCKSLKVGLLMLSAIVQLAMCLPRCRRLGFDSQWSDLFNHHVYNDFGGRKIYFYFNSLHLFILFLPLCTFENERSVSLFLNVKCLKQTVPLQGICRLGPRFQQETQNQTETRDKKY
jgi:hypothetical protein